MYRAVWDPDARLFLVGGTSAGPYQLALSALIERLGLHDAVHLVGSVPPGALGAHFATADVFVCVSEHEGFCVPLIEAMWWGLPVVAFASSAVPETVGDAAVLVPDKTPATVAAAVDRVVRDPSLRAALAARGKARVEYFAPQRTAAALLDAVRSAGIGA
jgi:glycosyltransferase involved in cell wall biosynthesis